MAKIKKLNIDKVNVYMKNNFGKRAKFLVQDKEKTAETVNEAIKKAKAKNEGPIFDILHKALLMFSLVKDWAKGDYREVPLGSIIAIVVGILYFLSPIDLIPDFLPGGYIDDALVLGLVFKQTGYDLEKYKSWKALQLEVLGEDDKE